MNPTDLVFYLKDADSADFSESDVQKLRKRYWTYALTIIQRQNACGGNFANTNPASLNTVSGYFGIRGFSINCVADYDFVLVGSLREKEMPYGTRQLLTDFRAIEMKSKLLLAPP